MVTMIFFQNSFFGKHNFLERRQRKKSINYTWQAVIILSSDLVYSVENFIGNKIYYKMFLLKMKDKLEKSDK